MSDTMPVRYTGTSDVQIFDASDMTKAGLEDHGFKKTSFPKGETVEVPTAVGEALVAKDGLFGDYSFEEVTDDGEDDSSEHEAAGESEVQSDEAGAVGEGPVDTASGSSSRSTARGTRTSRSTRGSAT